METDDETPERAKAAFDHKHNITVGAGRVIYALECHPVGRDPLLEGWALPGGRRTTSRSEAFGVACAMDGLMSGQAVRP